MKIKQILLSAALIMGAGVAANAQVKVGNNPTTINPNSILEMESTNKGMLLPRVALTGTANVAPLAAHVAGMTVYNTATAGDVTPGYYYNDGAKWVRLADTATDNHLGKTNQTIPAATNRSITLSDRTTSKLTIAPTGEESNVATLNVIGGNVGGGITSGIQVSDNYQNNTVKIGSIKTPQFVNANPPVQFITSSNNATTNELLIGGSNSLSQANPSVIRFAVDGDNDLTNSAAASVPKFPLSLMGGTGNVGIGTSAPRGNFEVSKGTAIGATLFPLSDKVDSVSNFTMVLSNSDSRTVGSVFGFFEDGPQVNTTYWQARHLEALNRPFNLALNPQGGNIGIGAISPKATLDVTGRPASATVADGIIAPRLTGDQLAVKDAVYTAGQTAAQVYVTAAATAPAGKTINVTAPGAYYFDGAVWQKVAIGTESSEWQDATYSGLSGIVAKQALAVGDTVFISDKGNMFLFKEKPAGYSGTPDINTSSSNAQISSQIYTNDGDGISRSGNMINTVLNGGGNALGFDNEVNVPATTTSGMALLRGRFTAVKQEGSGLIGTMTANETVLNLLNGSATEAAGSRSTISLTNGVTATRVFGHRTTMNIGLASNVVTDITGHEIGFLNPPAAATNTPNAYGLRIGTITAGVNNYAIFTGLGKISVGDAIDLRGPNRNIQGTTAAGVAQPLNINPAGGVVNFGSNIEVTNLDNGNRFSLIDLHSSDGVDYSSRVERASGVNGTLSLLQTGTGNMIFNVLNIAGQEMTVNSVTGNVGIGTDASQANAKLQVNGSIRATGGGIDNQQGSYLLWNNNVLQSQLNAGETGFLNHRGSGSGGFTFHTTNDNTSFSELLKLNLDGSITQTSVSYFKIAAGTTAQRPGAAALQFGMIRYNSTIGRGEMYVNDVNGDGTQGDAGWRAM